jgi:hypothetical protein
VDADAAVVGGRLAQRGGGRLRGAICSEAVLAVKRLASPKLPGAALDDRPGSDTVSNGAMKIARRAVIHPALSAGQPR